MFKKNGSEIKQPLTVSVLIPSHNEEKSIRRCVESILNQTVKPNQIITVNDGSTDNTLDILESFGGKITVVDLAKNTGNKSYAQEYGLWFIDGDIFISTDADTILDEYFIEQVIRDFEDEKVAAVCGYVKSSKCNWLTACREIDYAVGQGIHKLAQSYIHFIIVIPGCAAAFRTDIFRENVTFDHDTITEDLDFTYKLNERGFKIKYNKKAMVYTQDPADLKSYICQMKRWYGGGWQNLKKHLNIVEHPQSALELSLTYFEGIIFPLAMITLPFFSITVFSRVILFYLIVSCAISVYAAVISRRVDLIFYVVPYLVIMLINSAVFLTEFIKELILKKKNLIWFQPARRECV